MRYAVELLHGGLARQVEIEADSDADARKRIFRDSPSVRRQDILRVRPLGRAIPKRPIQS